MGVDEGLVDAQVCLVSAGADPCGTAAMTGPNARHEAWLAEPRDRAVPVRVLVPTQLTLLQATSSTKFEKSSKFLNSMALFHDLFNNP